MYYKTILDNVTLYNSSYRPIGTIPKGTQIDVISIAPLNGKEWATLTDDTMIVSKYRDIVSIEKVTKKRKG
jgi:hypothetical protein